MGIKISMQREVKERIRKEIIEAAQQYAEEYEIENYTDTASALNCVYAEFKDQFDWKIKRVGEHNAFIEWLKGLPMQFDYSYFDMRERIKYWFNQSNEEASKYSDEQVDKLYWNLLAREFFALVKKFKVSGIIKSEDNAKVTPYDMDDYLDNDNVLEESNMINSKKNILKMSDVDFQELYNEINKEIKNIDKKYIVKYMNKNNKNKISDSNGLKIFKLLPDGRKLLLYDKWKKYLSTDEINFALDKVAEKILNIDDEDINNVLEESNVVVSKDITSNDYDLYDLVIPKSTVCYLEYGECSPDDFTDEELDAVNEFASEWDIVDYGDLDNTDFRRHNDISNVFGASDCVEVKAKKKRTSVNKDITSEDMDNLLANVLEESNILSNTGPEDIEDYYIPIEYECVEDSDSDEPRPYVDYFKYRIYLDEVMRLNTPEVIDGIEYHGYMGISNTMSYMIHIDPSGDAVIVRESGADKLYNPNKKEIAVEESNILVDNDKRNPKIIKENPDGSGQVEYTRYTSHEKVRRTINVTADEMNRIKEAIASGNEDNIDNIFYNIG